MRCGCKNQFSNQTKPNKRKHETNHESKQNKTKQNKTKQKQKQKKQKQIDWSDRKEGPVGAKLLATSLAPNRTLMALDLPSNGLGVEGAAALAGALVSELYVQSVLPVISSVVK